MDDNEFKQAMATITSETLVSIVFIEKEDYQPTAVLTAKEELERRNLDPQLVVKMKKQAKKEYQKKRRAIKEDKKVKKGIQQALGGCLMEGCLGITFNGIFGGD